MRIEARTRALDAFWRREDTLPVNVELIRARLHEEPFRPFVVITSSGRTAPKGAAAKAATKQSPFTFMELVLNRERLAPEVGVFIAGRLLLNRDLTGK